MLLERFWDPLGTPLGPKLEPIAPRPLARASQYPSNFWDRFDFQFSGLLLDLLSLSNEITIFRQNGHFVREWEQKSTSPSISAQNPSKTAWGVSKTAPGGSKTDFGWFWIDFWLIFDWFLIDFWLIVDWFMNDEGRMMNAVPWITNDEWWMRNDEWWMMIYEWWSRND